MDRFNLIVQHTRVYTYKYANCAHACMHVYTHTNVLTTHFKATSIPVFTLHLPQVVELYRLFGPRYLMVASTPASLSTKPEKARRKSP